MILKKLKILVLKILSSYGYGLKRLRNFDNVLGDLFERVFQTSDPLIIFDVGANNGGSIERFQRLFTNYSIHIHSFEPSRRMFNELQKKYSGHQNVTLSNIGIGDKGGELIFNEHLTSHGSSSFVATVPHTYFADRRQISEQTVDKYKVQIESLDDYCSHHSIPRISFLKIDVQGLEELVIKGCEELLKQHRIDVIEVEVIIAQVYNRRTSFYDIEKGLVDYGYRAIALSTDGRFSNMGPYDMLQNKELQFDAIYVSPEVFKKISA